MLCALIAKSADSVVNAAEVVVEGVIKCGEAVSEAIGLLVDLADKGLLVNSGTDIGLSGTRRTTTIAISIATTKAAETITAPAEQEQDNNPPGAISPHAIAVAVAIVTASACPDVGGCHFASSERHEYFSFDKIYLCKQASRTLLSVNILSSATKNLVGLLCQRIESLLGHLSRLQKPLNFMSRILHGLL